MPSRDAHLQFQKWAQEYGPVYSLILGTKTLIVLSSDVAVKDLLDKKSAIYSDRQDMYIGQKLCSGDLRLLMMVSTPYPISNCAFPPNNHLALWTNLEKVSKTCSWHSQYPSCKELCAISSLREQADAAWHFAFAGRYPLSYSQILKFPHHINDLRVKCTPPLSCYHLLIEHSDGEHIPVMILNSSSSSTVSANLQSSIKLAQPHWSTSSRSSVNFQTSFYLLKQKRENCTELKRNSMLAITCVPKRASKTELLSPRFVQI